MSLQDLNKVINGYLVMFGLRYRQKYWGVVYDSQSKQPIDPAVLKLIDVDSGKVVETCITDINGRYGFLVWPGKFKILAKKSHYIFPSQKVTGQNDGVYDNLYHGEFFQVMNDSEVVSFNIPMDALEFDWNQQDKLRIVKSYPFVENLLYGLLIFTFWSLFILAAAAALFNIHRMFAFGLLIFYGITFLLAMLTPRPRLWGRLCYREGGLPVPGAIIEFSHKEIPTIMVSKTQTLEDGKYFVHLPKGNYILSIKKETSAGFTETLKQEEIKVGSEGVVTNDLFI